ncbi:hypothetical protein NP493_226g05003 [Ridgeia piscesae]|uniref:Uncharacterized protein n=1 Tax=Ridgeia piscesae TaxID=27915 RepID=A0AAD9P046_RIDPI|nr:hypothetical protein NP493_226g05003 [Ridgeia piscesae]
MACTTQMCVLLLLACVLAVSVSGGRVLYQCNKFCADKFKEEIIANNMQKNDDLVKKVIQCTDHCIDQLNERLRERGLEQFIEPNEHMEFED